MYYFLNFILECSMPIYRSTVDFCILILYYVTLLNLFVNFSSFFLVDLLGFSKYKILLSANGGNFSLSNLDAFYFSFLPDCTDLTSIQKSQEQISSLFPASGKAFHHSPLRCGCRGFVGDFYWVEKVPFFLLCQEFLS